MTVNIAFATCDYVIMASDKRLTNIDDTSDYEDTMEKTYKINPYVFVSVSGDYNVTVECLNYLKGLDLERAKVQAVTSRIKRFLKQKKKKNPNAQLRVLIGGQGDGNKMTLSSVRHDGKGEKIVLKPNEFRYLTNYANVPAIPILEHYLTKVDNLSYQTVARIIGRTIQEVANQDPFISPEYNITYLLADELQNT